MGYLKTNNKPQVAKRRPRLAGRQRAQRTRTSSCPVRWAGHRQQQVAESERTQLSPRWRATLTPARFESEPRSCCARSRAREWLLSALQGSAESDAGLHNNTQANAVRIRSRRPDSRHLLRSTTTSQSEPKTAYVCASLCVCLAAYPTWLDGPSCALPAACRPPPRHSKLPFACVFIRRALRLARVSAPLPTPWPAELEPQLVCVRSTIAHRRRLNQHDCRWLKSTSVPATV